MTLTCLLPAAGASSRMRGGDKLLELVEGAPCLAVMSARVLHAGMEAIVTVASQEHPRAKVLQNAGVRIVEVRDAQEGMAASLRAGASVVDEHSDGLMILPPDMPAIETGDLQAMIAAFEANPKRIIQATTQDGTAGHPVVFPKHLLNEFAALKGDRGASAILKAHQDSITYVALKDERARLDLDTPEAWVAWRASQL